MSKRTGTKSKRPTQAEAMQGMARDMQMLSDRTRPLSMIQGMAPPPFFGEDNEDVETFVDACGRAADYNCWSADELVGRLSYYLEGKAKWAYKGMLSDHMAYLKAEEPDDDDSATPGKPLAKKVEDLKRRAAITAAVYAVQTAFVKEEAKNDQEENAIALKMRQCDKELGKAEAVLSLFQAPLVTPDVKIESTQDEENAETPDEEKVEEGSTPPPVPRSDADIREILKHQELFQSASRHYAELEESQRAVRLRKSTFHERMTSSKERAELQAIAEYDAMTSAASVQEKTATEDTKPVKKTPDQLTFPDVEDFYQWLRETFANEDTKNRWMSSYYGRRHKSNEKVRDFSFYLTMLGQRAGLNLSEQDRARRFFEGLTKRMKSVIRLKWKEKGYRKDQQRYQWNELVRLAEKLEKDIPELCQYGNYESDEEDESTVRNSQNVTMASVQSTSNDAACDALEPDDVGEKSAPTVTSFTTTHNKNAEAQVMKDMMSQVTALLKTMAEDKAKVTAHPSAPTCTLCGMVGHSAPHCNTHVRRAVVCYNCGELGHVSTACSQPRRNAAGRTGRQSTSHLNDGRGIECYSCGEPGHISPRCPHRNNSGGRNAGRGTKAAATPVICNKCNKVGHRAHECRGGKPPPKMTGSNAIPVNNSRGLGNGQRM